MTQTRENISNMQTSIQWHDPGVATPPFETPILAVIGGSGSYGGRSISYRYVATVVVSESSINDDSPGAEYADFSDNVNGYGWDEFQFYVLTYEQHLEQADPEMDCDLYSDSILLWAPVPDLGAV